MSSKKLKFMSSTNSKPANVGCCVRPDLRLAIYLRDRFACLYCGQDLHGNTLFTTAELTLDHLTPQKEGADNRPTNLITACRKCNCSRRDKPWKQFATGGAVDRIARNRRRSIKRYRDVAKSLIFNGLKATDVTFDHYS